MIALQHWKIVAALCIVATVHVIGYVLVRRRAKQRLSRAAVDGDAKHVPFEFERLSTRVSLQKSKEYVARLKTRRSVRFFDRRPVELQVVENCVRAAGLAPSGANQQPWHYSIVGNGALKAQIREIVEREEKINYEARMGDKWVQDLAHLGTDWRKEYLTDAPYLVVASKVKYEILADGTRQPHYYDTISASISFGFFITAVHNAGLVTLTSTPLNAGKQIRELLQRPESEVVQLLLPVGYPARDATVPNIGKKPLHAISQSFL